jgi:hypothetical protein
VVPSSDQSDEERREIVAQLWTRTIDATNPKLTSMLQDIDALFEILVLPPEYTRTTEPGVRAFEDWDPGDPGACGPAFDLNNGASGPKATSFTNFSDDFIAFVHLDIGGGSFTPGNQRSFAAAQDELNESLPAWVDFRIFTSCGFILDTDLLDVTAFCDGLIIP